MKSKKGYVYRLYNTITKKSYVGRTTISIEGRIKSHFSHRNPLTQFGIDLEKYPKDIWQISVLFELDIPFDYFERKEAVIILHQKEQFFITKFKCTKNGYNLTGGNKKIITKNEIPYSEIGESPEWINRLNVYAAIIEYFKNSNRTTDSGLIEKLRNIK